MDKPRIVAQLIAPAPSGGAETVVRSLMAEGRKRRYHHHLLALLQTDTDSPLVDRLRAEGFPVTEIRCGRRQYRREAREVSRVTASIGADLIHSHVYHADLVGRWAAKQSRIPIVATAHGLTGGDWKNRFYQWLDLRALRTFDAVLAVSRPLRDTLQTAGVPAGRLHLIPNGFAPGPTLDRADARRRLGLDPAKPTLGWIGRFTEEKDPVAFVDLVAQLEVDGLQAVMLGDGPEEGRVRERSRTLGLDAATLHLAGRVDGAAEYLRALDVLVMTSRTEGTPMVLLEAMAAGTPIATYGVGGIQDFLDRDTACVVAAGRLDLLADEIVAMLGNPVATEQRVARAGSLLKERFDASAWLDRIETIYDSVVSAKQSARPGG